MAYEIKKKKKEDGYAEVDQKLSQYMMRYWVNFAKTGNPNGAGLPNWPQYKAAEDLTLEFGDQISVTQHVFAKELSFIEKVMTANQSVE